MQTEALLENAESTAIKIKKILVPIDFSPASLEALSVARRIAARMGAVITLLHVVEPIGGAPDFTELPTASTNADTFDAEKKLRRLANSLANTKIAKPKCSIATGVAAHEIIEAAKAGDMDLIIIATNGITAWKYFCIGSTAERVARAASCPVLLVREKEHAFR
jgi:nucleotide-binding universal stress UspA family protein